VEDIFPSKSVQRNSMREFGKVCVGTLKDGYVCNVPLPRAPWIQSANHVTSNKQLVIDSQDTCYLQVPRVPTWSDLTGSCTGLGRNIFPFCLFG
jgi:hypothetical protein